MIDRKLGKSNEDRTSFLAALLQTESPMAAVGACL